MHEDDCWFLSRVIPRVDPVAVAVHPEFPVAHRVTSGQPAACVVDGRLPVMAETIVTLSAGFGAFGFVHSASLCALGMVSGRATVAGRAGSTNQARAAPAAATATATRQPTLKLCWNAWTAAARNCSAAGRSPAAVRRWAATMAPPTDPSAVSVTPPGRPVGRVDPRRPAYSEAATLPITATPMVPPSNRVASLTAEPTPAWSLETTPMIASVAGALVSPIPVPRTSIWATICGYEVAAEVVAIHPKAAPSRTRPVVTTCLLPTRTASGV